jgi:hypothetical protein
MPEPPTGYTARPLDTSTWDAFATIVEAKVASIPRCKSRRA